MISKEQVRAARAYLDWDRTRLSEECGVSVPQIANLETGKTESPRVSTMADIMSAFLRHGVGFKDGGIVPKTDCTTRFEGEGWYLRLLDDVYQTLMDAKNPEAIVLFGSESKSPPEVLQKWKKIKNLGTRVRRVVSAGDTHLTGALQEYRALPAEHFNNHIVLIYAHKVAICAASNTMGLVIEDVSLSQTFKLMTDFYFSVLPQPAKSTAHDRF